MELAHGISVALYNTAFGLIVAIPSLMFFRHFRTRVDAYTLQMEQASERMVPHLLRLTGAVAETRLQLGASMAMNFRTRTQEEPEINP